jgi:hypothetical protein
MSDDDNIFENIEKLSDDVPIEEWKAAAKQRMRERMAKDPQAAIALVDGLTKSSQVQGDLDAKTDAEVADLLNKLEETLDLTVFSPVAVLLESACERLRRAGGGKTYDHRMGDMEEVIRKVGKTMEAVKKRYVLAGHGPDCIRKNDGCVGCQVDEAYEAVVAVLKG